MNDEFNAATDFVLLMPGVLMLLQGKVLLRTTDCSSYIVSGGGKLDKMWDDLLVAKCDARNRAHDLAEMGFVE